MTCGAGRLHVEAGGGMRKSRPGLVFALPASEPNYLAAEARMQAVIDTVLASTGLAAAVPRP